MKNIFLLIIFSVFVFPISFGQGNEKCGSIIINDSAFKKPLQNAYYSMEVLKNNKMFKLEKGQLRFKISFSGFGSNEMKLITDGILEKDSKGKSFYLIKFSYEHVVNMDKNVPIEYRENEQATIVFKELCFDISPLLLHNADYIKFYGEQEIIPCR